MTHHWICVQIFNFQMLPYRQRAAGAVIHTHSPNAVMATLLWPGKEFRCTYLEMIKVSKFAQSVKPWHDEMISIFVQRAFTTINWDVICAMMKSWWCQSLKIHQLKKIWRNVWTPPCKNIPDQQRFWCVGMVFTFGETLGRRQKHSKQRKAILIKL